MAYIPLALRPLSSYQRDEMDDVKRRLLKLETKEIPLTETVLQGGDILIGTATQLSGFWGTGQLQIDKASPNTLLLNRTSADSSGPTTEFLKRRSAWTVLNVNDELGRIGFSGADGTDAALGASIIASVNDAPGANVMPGRLVFLTSPSGSATPVERLRLHDAGALVTGKVDIQGVGEAFTANHSGVHAYKVIGGTGVGTGIGWRSYLIGANVTLPADNIPEVIGIPGYSVGAAIGFAIEDSTNTGMTFWTGGAAGNMTERMRITTTGKVGIGISLPTYTLHVRDGSAGDFYVDSSGVTSGYATRILMNDLGVKIGTNSARTVEFQTNSISRLVMLATGQVGINTVTPANMLQVHGTIYSSAADSTYTTAGWGKNIRLNSAGAFFWAKGAGTYSHGMGGTNGGFYFWRSTADDASAPPLYDFVITDAGDVGVGTAGPVDRLHIYGTGNAFIRVNSATFATGMQIGFDGSSAYLWNYQNTALTLATNNATSLQLTSGGNAIFPRCYVELRTDDSAGASSFWIRNNGIDSVISTKVGSMWWGVYGAAGMHHRWYNGGTTLAMHLDNTGRLGIGTIPGAKFHVTDTNGNFYYSGAAATSGYHIHLLQDDVGVKFGHNSAGRNLQLETNSTSRLMITAGGLIGLGVTPQSFFHGHTGIGGFLFTTLSFTDATVYTIIANGAGDVTERLHFSGDVYATDGTSAAVADFARVPGTSYTQVSGATGSTLVVVVNADGSVVAQRSVAGSDWRLTGFFTWR